MSDDHHQNEEHNESADLTSKDALKKEFAPGQAGELTEALFTADELDIYVNKVTLESYIFHGKDIHYPSLDRLEYDPEHHTVDVLRKDGTRIDLGVKIQWLVRPYFVQSDFINIVRTKDGKSIDGTTVPIIHKEQKK